MKKEIEIIPHKDITAMEIVLVKMGERNLHAHKDLEIGLVLEGSIHINVNGKQFTLQKNDLYLINHYQVHSFSKTAEDNLILAIQISGKLYKNCAFPLGNVEFEQQLFQNVSDSEELTSIKQLLLEIAATYFSRPDFFELRCISLLHELLFSFLNSVPHRIITEREQNLLRQNTNRLNSILDFMEEHYNEKISLADLASKEHLSVHYLSHFIKNMLGISFQEHLNNLRFEEAFRLVTNTDLTIMDICMETGISSSRYLNQMFVKHFDCEIRQYRMNHASRITTKEIPARANTEQRITGLSAKKLLNVYHQNTTAFLRFNSH